MNSILRHLTYLDLLYNCLTLAAEDARRVAHHSGMPGQSETNGVHVDLDKPYGIFSSVNHATLYFQGVRSIPSETQKLIHCDYLSKRHNLEGIAGFYLSNGRWKLNLYGKGILKPYREGDRITGLFIYRSFLDSNPKLLSSENLYKGTPAIQPVEQEERELAYQ